MKTSKFTEEQIAFTLKQVRGDRKNAVGSLNPIRYPPCVLGPARILSPLRKMPPAGNSTFNMTDIVTLRLSINQC